MDRSSNSLKQSVAYLVTVSNKDADLIMITFKIGTKLKSIQIFN